MKRIIALSVLVTFMTMTAFGQGNPLFSNEETSVDSMIEITLDTIRDVHEIPTDTNALIQGNSKGVLLQNTKIQKQIRDYIAQLSHRLKDEGDGFAVFWILLFSFLYGIAHSLGPGHNKVVVFSYFLSEKPKIKDGILMGNLAAFIHALSGLTVALVILFVIKETTSSTFDQSELTRISMLISFGMIVIIGGFMLYHHIMNFRVKLHDEVNTPSLKVVPMAFAVGIIPCPGTIILVTFLATMGFLQLSIFAALFMALGMGFTISLIGVLTILMKKGITRFLNNDEGKVLKLQKVLSIIGAVLIMTFGMLFFLGAW